MVPDVAKAGHSFKGAFAYYLHDKRQEGDTAHPETAERVAWTQTRNLMTDDPETARRVMVATAQQADQLKAAAGVKASGRKSTAHVYAYSLAWHPDEAGRLDRAEMMRAAEGSLKALNAEHLQAVIVCHQDQKHPHLHVILNRVDPATGRMFSTSNDRLKLSDWANQYERERGQIVTPKREEKRQIRAEFAKAQEAKAERSPNRKPRQERQPRPISSSANPAAMLKEFQEAQKVQHRQQFAALAAGNKAARDRIYSNHGARITEAMGRHKAETKAIWAQHFRQARHQQAGFAQRERELGGIVRNALAATAHQQATTGLAGKGQLSATFGNVLSSQARRAAFDERQNMTRAELAKRLKSALDTEIQTIKAERGAALSAQRQQFDQARSGLVEKQTAERAKIREAWQQIYTQRGKDAATRAQPFRQRMERKRQWETERAAVKEHRAANVRPEPVETSAAQRARLHAERKAREAAAFKALYPTAQNAPAPKPENPQMKGEFDKARIAEPPKPAATKLAFVSRPAPMPSPAGEAPRPAPKTVQAVPATPQPKPKPTVPVMRKDWSATATPAMPAPAKDWSKAAADQPREIKPLPVRDPTKPRDRDR